MKISIEEYLSKLNEYADQQRDLCEFFIVTMQTKGFDVDQMTETVELLKEGLERAKLAR